MELIIKKKRILRFYNAKTTGLTVLSSQEC